MDTDKQRFQELFDAIQIEKKEFNERMAELQTHHLQIMKDIDRENQM